MANIESRKKTILASVIIAIVVALAAFIVYPTYVGNVHAEYMYALEEANWTISEENIIAADPAVANVHTITIDLKGYAFERVDQETLKQFEAETRLTITIGPKEEGSIPNVDVTGSVKVNDAIYRIQNGTAALRAERRILYIGCEGVDQEGNKLTLKIGAVYFWWGGRIFALRSKALLTFERSMLLLQRGIAKIQ